MTEFAIRPSHLLMTSPNSSMVTFNNTPMFNRRPSIRRGTISSISKDVRVNDFVQIIKQQKALQQKERIETETNSLKRRHSMVNINQQLKPTNPKKTLPSRQRTMSIGNLRSSTEENKQAMAAAAKLRLDEKAKGKLNQQKQDEIMNHLRKCAACRVQPKQEQEQITSSASSVTTTLSDDILPSKHTSSSSVLTTKEIIIQDLNSSMTSYANQIQHLSSNLLSSASSAYSYASSTSSLEHKDVNRKRSSSIRSNKIQECKALIVQQQELLNKLEALCLEPKEKTFSEQQENSMDKPKDTFVSSVFKSLATPKPTTTQIVIKQTPDKNELNTVFSVQGVCTTTEALLIPKRVLSHDNKGIHQHRYSLDLTYTDRKEKFVLKPSDQWQEDSQVQACQHDGCKNTFGFFQRKHHCRSCGHIYCSTHSGNRLPLFTPTCPADKPTFSRVCDHCFYGLAGDSLAPYS